jgi:septin 7
MHFELSHHSKTRTKSVQFDRKMSADDQNFSPVPRKPMAAMRTSSLPTGPENAAVRQQYRSLLVVEAPPRLPAAKPMSYDELYPKPTTGSRHAAFQPNGHRNSQIAFRAS